MNKFEVKQEQCTGCGLCKKNCPRGLVDVKTNQAVYKTDCSDCVSCLHCVTICPNDAIHCKQNALKGVTFFNRDENPNPILLRRSHRHYKNKSISDELLSEIVNGANMAPRATIDFEERKFIVITNKQKIRKLRTLILKQTDNYRKLFGVLRKIPLLPKGIKRNFIAFNELFTRILEDNKEKDCLFREAPALVMVTGPKDNSLSPDNSFYAMNQLMILAEEKGLGTCIIGTVSGFSKVMEPYLGVAKDYKIFSGAIIGYPENRFERYATRNDSVIDWH
ncbi:MAG: 4Fe-4S dicluster domain-containing protein [bacterium]|nr:4Fe-4S dicluster domain-containing protein [bacterium]